jgi:hypothetical protein
VQIGAELPGLLAEAYSGASAIANLLGYLDLCGQVVERIRWASELSGDPLRMQRVHWQRTASLMEQVRADLGDDLSVMDGPALSVYGSAHIDEARLVANRMGADRNDYRLAREPARPESRPSSATWLTASRSPNSPRRASLPGTMMSTCSSGGRSGRSPPAGRHQ